MQNGLTITRWAIGLCAGALVIYLFLVGNKAGEDGMQAIGLAAVVSIIAIGIVSILNRIAETPDTENWTDGRVGVGTVTDWQSLYSEDRPHRIDLFMKVESENGTNFHGTLRTLMPRSSRKALQRGYQMPVIFQESNPAKLYLPSGRLAVSAQLMFDYVQYREGLIDQPTLDADYWGIPTQAEVTSIRRTGVTHGQLEQVELELFVYPAPGGEPIESSARMFLSEAQQLRLNDVPNVKVKYLPHSPSRVIVRMPEFKDSFWDNGR